MGIDPQLAYKSHDGLTCNARALHALLLLAREQYSEFQWELEVEPALRDPDGLDLDGRLPIRDVLGVASVLARLTGDQDLGLKWGQKAADTHPGFLGVICSSSPTLGHALFNVASVLPVIAEVGELCIGSTGGRIKLQLIPSDRALAAERYFMDCLLVYLVKVITTSSADGVAPVSVEMMYESPRDTAEAGRLLNGDTKYSQSHAGFTFESESLASAMRFPHRGLLRATLADARRLVEELDELNKFRRLVSARIRSLLDKPNPTLDKVAQRLNMSRRTLQRRLDESGLSFREVLKHERHELALELLEDSDNSIADIAYKLGFANQSAFSRAFRLSTGISPRDHRSRAKELNGSPK